MKENRPKEPQKSENGRGSNFQAATAVTEAAMSQRDTDKSDKKEREIKKRKERKKERKRERERERL